eukprot:6169296-Amphidinium_carterae.1
MSHGTAILKRAWTIVLGQHQVYSHAPMPTEVDVMVVPYPANQPKQEVMLNPSGVVNLHRCKTLADKSKPTYFDDGLAWSMALLDLCLADEGVLSRVHHIPPRWQLMIVMMYQSISIAEGKYDIRRQLNLSNCGDDTVDLKAVCADDKALYLVTITEACDAIDEMTNKAGENKAF